VARTETIARIREFVGERGADAVQMLVSNAATMTQGITATVVGMVVLLWAASRVFVDLRDAVNDIWGVDRRDSNVLKLALLDRLASFGMVLLTGAALLGSMVATTILQGLRENLGKSNPVIDAALARAYPAVSFGIVFVLFAVVYKVLPARRVAWGDVWLGALTGAGLFGVGKYLIGVYLGRTSLVSVYGAAGSLVVLLLWIYYSAQILLLGAVLSAVYAERVGSLRERHATARS
jgi:membrane protein